MATQKSVYELTREWRETIVNRLDKLDASYSGLSTVCTDIRIQLQKLVEIDGMRATIEAMEKKIRSLEDSRLRFITIAAVVQTVLLVVWAIINKTLLK